MEDFLIKSIAWILSFLISFTILSVFWVGINIVLKWLRRK
jgi:hypothetical protein